MPKLAIKLLGGFDARAPGAAVLSFPTKKTKALLAYLLVPSGQSHSRSDLAHLLWGDSADGQARASLRQTLSHLRKALAPINQDHLIIQGDLVSIDPATVQVDVAVLEALGVAEIASARDPASELYPGDFLEGFDLREEAFNHWMTGERARLRAHATEILAELLSHHMAARQWDDGLRVARGLLALDPLQERVHRALMRLHLSRGERALALKQYENCAQILRLELDVEPDQETQRIWVEACAATSGDGGGGADGQPVPRPKTPGGVTAIPAVMGSSFRDRRKRPATSMLALAIMAGVVAVAVGWVGLGPWAPDTENDPVTRTALPLPDKPSIAVLPFVNLGGDPEQDYFADGMTEDIITDLAKLEDLFVIGRNSTFAYKGKSIDVRQVSRDLGVGHVLEGSVRRAGGRVRINAQLIDAKTGGHVWAERYDADLSNVFNLQDKLTRHIVEALVDNLSAADAERLTRRDTNSVLAHDAYMQGLMHYKQRTRYGMVLARQLLTRAVELDPNYSRAYAALAAVYWRAWETYWFAELGLESWFEAWIESDYYLAKAMENPTPLAHQIASRMLYTSHKFDEAIVEAERAVALEPGRADSYVNLASVFNIAGRHDQAVALIKKAMRLDPQYPASFLLILGHAQFHQDKFEDAALTLERAAERNPDDRNARMYLAATYGHLDRRPEAMAVVATVNRLRAEIKVSNLRHSEVLAWPYQRAEDKQRMISGLRKAGVPE